MSNVHPLEVVGRGSDIDHNLQGDSVETKTLSFLTKMENCLLLLRLKTILNNNLIFTQINVLKYLSQHEKRILSWINVGSPSATLAQQ